MITTHYHHSPTPTPTPLSLQPPNLISVSCYKFIKSHLNSSFKFNNFNLNLPLCSNNNMGLSPFLNPSDAGVLCVILVNTAMSISIVKEIVCSILHMAGIRIAATDQVFTESFDSRGIPSETYMEEFRSQTPSLTYMSLCCATKEELCSVCLTEFKPDAEINHLSCGHVFHKFCLEKWLEHRNVTCPLCRNHMIVSKEVEENTCPP